MTADESNKSRGYETCEGGTRGALSRGMNTTTKTTKIGGVTLFRASYGFRVALVDENGQIVKRFGWHDNHRSALMAAETVARNHGTKLV